MAVDDWSLLRTVLAVSRHNGLSGAARELGVNQATVSRQIAKAEAAFGARLFDRVSTGMQPTRAGLVAVDAAERMNASMKTLDLSLAEMDSGVSGVVRLTVPRAVTEFGLAEDLVAFRRAYPQIRLVITSDDGIIGLGDRNVDVAVRAQDKPAAGLWGRRLAVMEYQFYGAEALFEDWGAAIERRDAAAALPLIQSTGTPPSVIDEFRKIFPEAVAEITCSGIDEFLPLLRRGAGFGLLPCFIAERCPELKRVDGVRTARTKTLWALVHSGLRETPRFRVLVDWLAERFAARAAEFRAPAP